MMSNKELFKRVFDEQFNSKKVEEEILSKKVKHKINLKRVLKWSLAPICLVIIYSSVLLLQGTKCRLSKKNDSLSMDSTVTNQAMVSQNIEININNIGNLGLACLDADMKSIEESNLTNFELFKVLEIPNDFDDSKYYSIYVRDYKNDQKEVQDSDYNILNNYTFEYYNSKNERSIDISFSDKNKPLRDYFFSEEGSKVSKIDNVELTIYNYETIYFTEFDYKGYYFDIETNDITQDELVTLLRSIIK